MINHISKLQYERRKKELYLKELEQQIKVNYQDIKASMHPKSLVKLALVKLLEMGTQNNLHKAGVINGAVSFGTSLLLKKVTALAEKKIQSFFKSKIEVVH